jgi:hypothetical protein
MADFSMWGPAESGVRLAQQDQQKTQLNAIVMQDMQAQMRERNAKAGMEEQAARQQQQDQAAMSKIAQAKKAAEPGQQLGQAEQMSSQLSDMAQYYADSGQPVKAAALLEKVAQIGQHTAAMKENQAKQVTEGLKGEEAKADYVARQVSAAKNNDEFQQALQGIEAQGIKLPDRIKAMTYSPENVKKLQDMSLSFKDKLNLQRQADNEKRLEEKNKTDEAYHNKMLVLTERRIQDVEERHAATGKTTGSKPVTPQERKLAESELMTRYQDMDPKEAYVSGMETAELARKLKAESGGKLSDSEAMKKAADQKEAKGDFKNYMKAPVKHPPVDKAAKAALGTAYNPEWVYRLKPGTTDQYQGKPR